MGQGNKKGVARQMEKQAETRKERGKRPFILRRKHRKFLEKYVELGDIGDAYLAARYKSKSKIVATASGSKLLAKIDQNIDWKEVVDAVCPNTKLASRLASLLDHRDGRVAVTAGGHLTRIKGWSPPEVAEDRRIQVLIMVDDKPVQIQEGNSGHGAIDVEPVKPKQIID
jgi:hypothetical protein